MIMLLIIYLTAGVVLTMAAAIENADQRSLTRWAVAYHRGPNYALLIEAVAAAVTVLTWPRLIPGVLRSIRDAALALREGHG